ncbi:MAG: T9SS type A sorting domain-containing protein [Bacteroidetes bacterium]|nr:T9SS type A sorting domain-containing protein [Bacteroidota bacterium]
MQGSTTAWWRNFLLLPLLIGVVTLTLPSIGQAQLNGTYTIGSSGSYTTFTSAVSALTTSGVSGPVTFTVLAGTYNEEISIPAITGASAVNTITFDGGTGNAATRIVTYQVTATYGAVITLDGADYIRIKNLSVQPQSGTSYGIGIKFTNSADYNIVSDCVIELPANTTTTGHIGINASTLTSYSAYGAHGSNNLIQNNTIISGYYGIRWNGSTSTDYTAAHDNQFIGNTLTDFYYYGMYCYYGGAYVIKSNTAIQRSTGTTTTSGYGIYSYYMCNGPEISYNYGVARTGGVSAGYMNNAYASTTNRAKFYNNMSISEGTSTAYGLATYNPKYADITYNSCRAKTTTGTVYGFYCYGAASSYDVKLQNNMVSCETDGTFYAIYMSASGAAANYSVFDYNVLYKTGTSATQYCYWSGTNYTTFAAMKAAVTGYHQHSVEADPMWYSDYDLHSTSLASYHTGTPVTGFTDDFDNDTRHATTPCIGADEYILSNMAFVSSTCTQNNTDPLPAGFNNQEIIGIEVDVTGSLSPLSATSFTCNTTGSTVPGDISAAKIWYTERTSTFDVSTATLVGSVSNPSGTFTITGSQALIGPGTNYFWLTYDVSAAASTGDYMDGQCTSVTIGGTPYTPTVTNPAGNRMIIAPMNGAYTINATGTGNRNFTTFGAAITALGIYGVGGPVTFTVAAGTYDEQLTFTEVLGASATKTITFTGGTGNAASRIISNNVASTYQAVITLDGADYFKFKNLTINSTNSSYGYGFLFTNQASDNEISDCVINLPSNTTSSYHIGIIASSTSSYSAYGDWGDNNLIKDNEINSGYYGIRWNGYNNTSNTTIGHDNQFIGNTLQDYYYYGIYLYYSVSVKVHENTMYQRTSGSVTTGGYGIYSYYANLGPEFIGNYIHSNDYGMYTPYCNYNYTSGGLTSVERGKIVNNMIVCEHTSTSTIYGHYCYYSRYTDIGFNSINIVRTGASGTTYGYYHGGTSTNYDTKFSNNYVAHDGASTTFYPIYHSTLGDVSENDFNAYWDTGLATTVSFYWGTTYSTLAAMQAAVSGYHQNSVWGDPYFISTSDLHSRSHVGYQAGVPFASVTDDFDGQARGAAPCIGADEYPAPPPEIDAAVTQVMLMTAVDKWAHREDPEEHAVKVVLENTGLGPNPTTIPVTYKLGSMPANIGDGVQETFTPTWNGAKTVVEFTQKLSGLAVGPVAVYAKAFVPGDGGPANDGGMDNATVQIVKVQGFENFDRMNVSTYPLTRDPGYLDLPWTVIDNNGGMSLEVLGGMGVGGSQGMAMMAPSESADEWLVTPGAMLMAGSSYRLAFDFQNAGGSPVTIEAAFGETPDPSQMTVFATFANIAPGGFLTAKQLAGGLSPYFNTSLNNAINYVAFHFTTSGSNSQFVIDNIKIDDNPSPPPKIAFGLPGTDLSTFIDNPATKITLIANYKSPGVINRTYEVQSKTNIYGANGDFLWDVETSTPWITLTKEVPNPTLQNYNFAPPRPRQFQTFTMSVNPSGLAPGTHIGEITFYGMLFNDDFPPPSSGLVATNEPLAITVELKIVNAGSKGGPTYIEGGVNTVMTVPGSPYDLVDVNTGDPIATVHVTSGQINSMTIRAYPNQLPQNIARMLYVKRYWQVTYTGTGWTADITFPYSDQEASMISDKSQLRSVRQAVPLGAWESPTLGTTSASDVANNMVRVSGFSPANIDGNLALAHPYQYAGKEPDAGLPEAFTLEQNYPNPFNPTTNISFTVAEERHVRIAVYNSLGAEVAELVNEVLPAGRYDVTFDASALPSGTYLYRMMSGGFVATQRMTLSK